MVVESGWSPRRVHCESTAVAGSGRAAGRWSMVAAFSALWIGLKTPSPYQPGSRTILYDSLAPTDANVRIARHSANVNGVPTWRRMVSSRFASDYIGGQTGASDRLMWSGHKAPPDHPSASTGPFTLGSMDNHATADAINTAYEETVHFRPNTFSVPQGSAGKAFISQVSCYQACFGDAGPYESQAIKIAMVFQQLPLQKNPQKSLSHSFAKCLQRCLGHWNKGDLHHLLHKCRTIQHLIQHSSSTSNTTDAKVFAI